MLGSLRHVAKCASIWSGETPRREQGIFFITPDYSTILQLEKTVTNLSRKEIMSVLIAGGTGFTGAEVVRQLLIQYTSPVSR